MIPEKILVNVRDEEEIRVARVVDGKIEGIHWANDERSSLVGSVHQGEISKIEEGLEAAFVDFAGGRAGFLHAGDIHPSLSSADLSPFIAAGQSVPEAVTGDASPSLGERVVLGRKVLVQVKRDAVKGKGATLTTFLSLPGRFLVLLPSMGKIAFSRRIAEEEEREEIASRIDNSGLPEGMGVIVRTAAKEASIDELRADLKVLLAKWGSLEKSSAAAAGPGLLLPAANPVYAGLESQWTSKTKEIIVDNPDYVEGIRDFLGPTVEQGGCSVKIWGNSDPMFEAEGVEKDYQALFQSRIPIGSGASIVIQETEALTSVDVNSGRLDRGSLEETALATNLLAAVELARQIRLRDIGGIVVVDFIDQRNLEYRSRIEEVFSQALESDRSRLKLGRLTSFGLFPLTRRKKGTGMAQARSWSCEACGGGGNISHVRAGALRIIRRLRSENSIAWRVRLQPAVADFLQEQFAEIWAGAPKKVDWEADPQVPASEPVFEKL